MRQNLLEELNSGCSALSWSTLDQKHFWGRNLDFNRLAAETKVTYVPRGTEYCFVEPLSKTLKSTMQNNLTLCFFGYRSAHRGLFPHSL